MGFRIKGENLWIYTFFNFIIFNLFNFHDFFLVIFISLNKVTLAIDKLSKFVKKNNLIFSFPPSRCAVRELLRRNFQLPHGIKALKIPRALKRYLDLMQNWRQSTYSRIVKFMLHNVIKFCNKTQFAPRARKF